MIPQKKHLFSPFRLAVVTCLLLATSSPLPAKKNKTGPAKGVHVVTQIEEYRRMVKENGQMEMVDLEQVIPGIQLDIRYATENNFTGEIIYPRAKAYLRRPVAEALRQVDQFLQKYKAALRIYDAYRPYAATVRFYEVCDNKEFVADPRYGSRHNRGCSVDLTLIDLDTGREFPMPSDFDDFSEKAYPDNMNLPKDVINNRSFLFQVMAKFGFRHYPTEWWHFDFDGWEQYPLMDLSFEDLEKTAEK